MKDFAFKIRRVMSLFNFVYFTLKCTNFIQASSEGFIIIVIIIIIIIIIIIKYLRVI